MNGSALSTLVRQGELTSTAAQQYLAAATVEVARLSLANFSAEPQAVTVYHRLKADDSDPGDSRTVGVYTVEPYATVVDPEQGSSAITLQDGDSLWAKAVTIASDTAAPPSRTLVGSAFFDVTSANDWTNGASTVTIPSSDDCDLIMLQDDQGVEGRNPVMMYNATDFDALTAGTHGASVSGATALRQYMDQVGRWAYYGITSTRRLLYTANNVNKDATVTVWCTPKAASSASVTQVDGINMSIYVTPQETAPNSEIV